MHKINQALASLLISWLVLPAMSMAAEDDLLVLTVFPKNGVYDKSTLTNLVKNTEKLWTIKDETGSSVFKTIDSLATENIIVAQQDSVRFRRLIESRELTDSGLKTLKSLVNSHPLLHDRLADAKGEQLHIWLRVNSNSNVKKELLESVRSIISQGESCKVSKQGFLSDIRYEEWKLISENRESLSQLYKKLLKSTENIKDQSILAYSATDLIQYLKQSMSNGILVDSNNSAEIEQLYMIAESVRSRHLHDLANPNFSRLKLVRMSNINSDKTRVDDFSTDLIRQWVATDSNYLTLDCRA
ncbi:MAG: hypothetical protein JXR16_12255 [Bermanella sp.]